MMDKTSDKLFCMITCAIVASLVGFGAMAALMLVGGWTLIQAVFAAAVVWAVLTGVLLLSVCGNVGLTAQESADKARAEMAAARLRVQGAVPASNAVTPRPAPDRTPAKPAAAAPVVAAAEPSPAPAAPAAVETAEVEGTRPQALTAARDGKADDLKQIKGVGPKMEKMCNALGFYHFDQIAAWTASEVAWVDQNLEGFKGRVTRDAWVEQAKTLAAGGETEFSKRVEDGDVY